MSELVTMQSGNMLIKRQIIYSFLKRFFEKEISREFLAQMPEKMKPLLAIADLPAPLEIKKAVKELVQFTDTIPSQDLVELELKLAADYARLFLSLSKVPAHPSESVYLEGTLMQNSRDEVLKTYWSFGVSKKDTFTEPEDHIAVELSFVMYLCGKCIEASRNEDLKEARRYLQGQQDFLEEHLLIWVPKLVKDITNVAQTPLYKGIGALTQEFIQIDLSVIKGILEQMGT